MKGLIIILCIFTAILAVSPVTAQSTDKDGNVNCINCKGCSGCVNCIDCNDCHGCNDCRSCNNCNGCVDCTYCNDCNGSVNSHYCTGENGSVGLTCTRFAKENVLHRVRKEADVVASSLAAAFSPAKVSQEEPASILAFNVPLAVQ